MQCAFDIWTYYTILFWTFKKLLIKGAVTLFNGWRRGTPNLRNSFSNWTSSKWLFRDSNCKISVKHMFFLDVSGIQRRRPVSFLRLRLYLTIPRVHLHWRTCPWIQHWENSTGFGMHSIRPHCECCLAATFWPPKLHQPTPKFCCWEIVCTYDLHDYVL